MAFAGWSFAGSAWGWNVWVDPIFAVFYGDEPKTMANGQVVYAFSLIVVASSFGLAALSLSGLTRPGLELDFCCLGQRGVHAWQAGIDHRFASSIRWICSCRA